VVHDLNATLARCRELFLAGSWRTRERIDQVSALLNPLYAVTPPDPAEMKALASLACGGWCWREVECGDRSAVHGALLGAYTRTIEDAEVPRSIVEAVTAWRYLEDGGVPGVGSPGRDEADRIAFLGAAAQRFFETYGAPAGVARESGLAAFFRGVALNDVERLVSPLQLRAAR
jgi:hypothetical protein